MNAETEQDLRPGIEVPIRRLKALIAFRICLVTLLVGSFMVFRIGHGIFPYSFAVMYLIAAFYGMTIVHLLLLGRLANAAHAYIQIIGDVTGTVALIAFTGGIESGFTSLLILNVISAAIVAGRRAGYLAATLSALLYGVLLDAQFNLAIPAPYEPITAAKAFLFNLFSHITALYLTAFLMGILVRRLERQATSIMDLTAFNREVIEHTPSGLFTTDSSGRIQVFNRAAELITGIGREQALGAEPREIFPFLPREGQWPERSEQTVSAGGGRKIIGLTISDMHDSSGVGHIGVFEDLTEMKKMAEEMKRREKLAAIGELSANMAHEIRNPLASLKSSIELIREASITPEQRSRLMGIAINEMDRLNTIVTDFLDYARPAKPKMQPCDLHQTLDRAADVLVGSGHQNVQIKRLYQGPLPIVADPEMLGQVFLNIGLNAFDAMPDGGTLEISTAVGAGRRVEVRFRDTGTGIEAENLERVFYPFYTTKKKGTGIGLSIVYRIVVEDHGGTVRVKSPPEGPGTVFVVELPLDGAGAAA